ncbi:MAG: hypothetical protein ACOYZ8_13610 [Chloroflexota bacterium]
MRFVHVISLVATILSMIVLSACGNGAPTAKDFEDFDPSNFDHPTSVDNLWLPLKPGTQFVYEGMTVEEGESLPHRVVITVTDLTKVIEGVRSVVTWDLDYSDGELVEAELAFFAQDNDGNVWRMGEYPEEYEGGEFVAAPTWIHGLEDARAGIAMKADPEVGDSYSQGWGPAVDWTDRGQVDQVGQKTCVPADCYEDVLVIAETSQAEPGAAQLKYYAPNVGNIRVDWRGEDQTQETLELVEIVQLNSEALAEARADALKMEKHAYEVSPDTYARTSPVEYPEGTPAITIITPTVPTSTILDGPPPEIIVYASDLPESALYELDFLEDAASPGNKLIGIPNNGDELDPPPENDPHVTFKVQAYGGVPYRCWIHMKVGMPKGRSQANVVWVQFSGAVDEVGREILKPGTGSYLTAQGPAQEGWVWVPCDLEGAGPSGSLVYFQAGGEINVRIQAGMEGVGFDQFLLSPAEFLEQPPDEAIVEK